MNLINLNVIFIIINNIIKIQNKLKYFMNERNQKLNAFENSLTFTNSLNSN